MNPLAHLGFTCLLATIPIHAKSPVPDPSPDIWELRYHAFGLDPAADSDSDGYLNADEATAGTDPLDSTSCPRVLIGPNSATSVFLDIVSQPEKAYQVVKSPSPAGPWTNQGNKARAQGKLLRMTAPMSDVRGFFRIEISDDDTDRDGLTDWDEHQLAGFDAHNDDSFGVGKRNSDFAIAAAIQTALWNGQLQAAITTPDGFEEEQSAAVVTFTRTSDTSHPFTLFLRTGGASDPAKTSASPGEFTLSDAAGNPISGSLVIPAGQSSVTVHIMPLADMRREVPEQLHVTAGGATAGATVVLRDTVPAAANQLLFVANLRPILGTSSTGGGTATVRLPGDNDVASVALSFSNLRSPVQEVRIEAPDGTALAGVEPSGYSGQAWPIRAGGPYATDQEVLDALLSAELCVCIRSESHPSGEIRGKLIAASGTIEFAAPPGPPTVEPLAGSELDQDIARFLTQATFGPTMADIEAMRERVARHSGDRIAAFGEWIDEQFAMPSPSLLAYTMAADRQEIEVRASLPTDHPDYHPAYEPDRANRIRGWWLLARHGPDQLRQRTAFALSEIFVVSDHELVIRWRPYGMAGYYDMLRTGASGSYRELLEGVATHPVMGQYLSHLRNSKAVLDESGNPVISPDENFAREIMQLFSIGLVELHPDGTLRIDQDGLPIPTYHQGEIADMARLFTGWSFSVVNGPDDEVIANTNFHCGYGSVRREAQWLHPMAMFPEHHDPGAKTVLGLALPAGLKGEEELAAILDHLAAHPNTAPFICRRLIQRLVTANPSTGYLFRTARTFTASGGNLAATFKAILLDPEARSPANALASASSGKKREPLLRHLAYLRAFDGKTRLLLSDLSAHGYPAEELAKFPPGTPRLRHGNTDHWLAQTPLGAPSVFNWFPPDHSPAGILVDNGLASPEMQLTNEHSVFQETNFHHLLTYGSLGTVRVPGQDLLAPTYDDNSQKLMIDITPLEARYLAVVDANGDGRFSSLDASTFNRPEAIAAAAEAVVDPIDLLLCAGSLKARHGGAAGTPRRIILDAVAATQTAGNGVDHPDYQAGYMRDRIRAAIWLVMSSPDAIIQK